jgi:hypothetical protein
MNVKFSGALVSLIALPYAAMCCSADTSLDIGGGQRIHARVTSLKALRDANVVTQGYDYSCGAGALATLLTYGLLVPTTEAEVLTGIMAELSEDEQALRKKEGLSLLDLQKFVHARGHKAQGFRLAPEHLPKLNRPVIVFIRPRGHEHFAVLKGVRGDRVYLADPSLGNVHMPAYRFLDMWLDKKDGRGIVFFAERGDGNWPEPSPLAIDIDGVPAPEIPIARDMLEMGGRQLSLPPQ